MKTESLQMLLIDHALGELPPETAELLEAYLERDAEAQAEAERIRMTLATTGQTLREHPALVRNMGEMGVGSSHLRSSVERKPRFWMRAAAALLAACGIGVLLGRGVLGTASVAETESVQMGVDQNSSGPVAPPSLLAWTRYKLETDATSGRLVPVPIR